jgi:hypothetical protein
LAVFGQVGEKISCGKEFLKKRYCVFLLPAFLYYYFQYRKEIRKEKEKTSPKKSFAVSTGHLLPHFVVPPCQW